MPLAAGQAHACDSPNPVWRFEYWSSLFKQHSSDVIHTIHHSHSLCLLLRHHVPSLLSLMVVDSPSLFPIIDIIVMDILCGRRHSIDRVGWDVWIQHVTLSLPVHGVLPSFAVLCHPHTVSASSFSANHHWCCHRSWLLSSSLDVPH